MPAWSVDQIASGALVCPLNNAAPTAFTYYLLGLPELVDRPKIATFRKLLVAEAATTEAFMPSIGAQAVGFRAKHEPLALDA